MNRHVYITVADTSADLHAANLVSAMRNLDPELKFAGLGGPRMQAAGVELAENTVSGAAMGWRGALRVFEALRWRKAMDGSFDASPPDLHICIDSSAMNLPFARLAKSHGVPVLYYVAPQLWASREGRMRKLRKYVDHVACIFPFEEEYFRAHAVNATYVGHPLFDELPPDRQRVAPPHFPVAPPVIGVLPGSRKSEVKAMLPHLIDVMQRIKAAFANTTFLVPTTPAVDELVREMLKPRALNQVIELNGFDSMMKSCDLVITKSGTSTVHVAAWNVPMIVVYRVNPLLWHLAGRWLVKTKKIAMVNILAGQMDLVPEFIPWYGSNAPVADCAIDMLKNPEKLEDQRRKLRELMKKIETPGASDNTARLALSLMKRKPS